MVPGGELTHFQLPPATNFLEAIGLRVRERRGSRDGDTGGFFSLDGDTGVWLVTWCVREWRGAPTVCNYGTLVLVYVTSVKLSSYCLIVDGYIHDGRLCGEGIRNQESDGNTSTRIRELDRLRPSTRRNTLVLCYGGLYWLCMRYDGIEWD
jgi:hypothetical protein